MKTIVFIGANKSGSSYEALKASEELHYYTVLLTDRKSFFDKRMDFPHVHSMRMCNLENIDEVRSAIDRIAQDRFTVCAIVSFIDPHSHTAARLSREFGLQAFTAKAIAAMLDKVKSREALQKTPYSPPYRILNHAIPVLGTRLEMPVVLKAPVSSASKDVHVASTRRQYQNALAKLRKRNPDGPILVEKYMPGPQYLVETLTQNGRVTIIALIEQEIVCAGKFIVTGYQIITEEDSRFFRRLKQAVREIIEALGMRDGPCHLEFRHFDKEWKLIEANPRMSGGAMNLLIETAYGVNLARETLQFAAGLTPDLARRQQKDAFLQYVLVPETGTLTKVTGKNMAQNSPGVKQVYVKPKKGTILTPPASMGQRYAYVIAAGASADEAREHAKSAAAKIKFHLSLSDNIPHEPMETASGIDDTCISIDYFADNIVYEPQPHAH